MLVHINSYMHSIIHISIVHRWQSQELEASMVYIE